MKMRWKNNQVRHFATSLMVAVVLAACGSEASITDEPQVFRQESLIGVWEIIGIRECRDGRLEFYEDLSHLTSEQVPSALEFHQDSSIAFYMRSRTYPYVHSDTQNSMFNNWVVVGDGYILLSSWLRAAYTIIG